MQWKLGTLIAGAQVQSLGGELRPHNMCDVAKYIYLNGNLVKAMVFLVVMYGYEIWTIKKAECWRTVVLEKTLKSSLDSKEIQPVYHKGNQSWIFIGRTFAEAETPILWPPDVKKWLIGKDPNAGKDWRLEEKGTTEDERAGWHHRLDGREFEWTLGVGDGQGGLACCNSWSHRETWLSDWTELNWTELRQHCTKHLHDPVKAP